MRIALYQPDIPQNTGTILRLAACLGVAVDVIGPTGFDMTDRALRRAGLDYLNAVEIARHRSWLEFLADKAARAGGLAAGTAAEDGRCNSGDDDARWNINAAARDTSAGRSMARSDSGTKPHGVGAHGVGAHGAGTHGGAAHKVKTQEGPAHEVRTQGKPDNAAAPRVVLLTTHADHSYAEFSFRPSDILLLGRESAGVPAEVHDAVDARIHIPLRPELRSLNIAVAAAMVLGEAARQTSGFPERC